MTASLLPRRGLSAEKRAAIVEAARHVFLKEGFGAAGMDAIAARAAVSKMTVYRHFESKDALFSAIVEASCAKIIDADMRTVLTLPPAAALPQLALKMAAILYAPETIELHRLVVAESRQFPRLGALFYASGPQACIAMLTDYFSRHRRPGRTRDDVRRAAEDFLETVRGYPHLRVLLGLDQAPSNREMRIRIDRAVRNALRDDVAEAMSEMPAASARRGAEG